jgi:hypothetical protein
MDYPPARKGRQMTAGQGRVGMRLAADSGVFKEKGFSLTQ